MINSKLLFRSCYGFFLAKHGECQFHIVAMLWVIIREVFNKLLKVLEVKSMKYMLSVMLSVLSLNAFAWGLDQVKIKHVQITEYDNLFYMSIDKEVVTASGCNVTMPGKSWLAFKIEAGNEAQKAMISLATAAYLSGTRVDVGSIVSGCISSGLPVANLGYIRLGDYR